MSGYYKTVDKNGQLTKLQYSPVKGLGEEISHTEYCMTKIGIRVFIGGEDPEAIRQEDWWR